MRIPLSFFLFFFFQSIYGQEGISNWLKKLEHLHLQPIVAFQVWSNYTHNMEVFDETEGLYVPVENRLNTQLHRSRFGIKGAIYSNLKFNLTTSLDFVGRDVLSATHGGNNNGASPSFRLWSAFLQWKIKAQSDAFHLTTGYILPQIGRGSITSAFRVPSMEKSWSQNYLRRHLMGTGPGRTVGVNLGGQFLKNNLGFRYDIGLFNPLPQAFSGNSTGEKSSPLFVGRFVLQLGAPEAERYKLGHKINYFGKRKGLSIALSGALQGATDWFDQQNAIGLDWLLNWGNINLDGEYTLLKRTGAVSVNLQNTMEETSFSTGYFRMSYNIILNNKRVLEPAFMLMHFTGSTDEKGQLIASDLHSFSGTDRSYDIGVNYYFNPDLKLSLHYVWNEGNAGTASPGKTINNYFTQSGAGAIRRGNWLGLGLVVIM